MLFLPPWTLVELQTAAQAVGLMLSQVDIAARHLIYGGSARWCLAPTSIAAGAGAGDADRLLAEATEELRTAARACTAATLLKLVKSEQGVAVAEYAEAGLELGRLIHIMVDPASAAAYGPASTSYAFASPKAAELVIAKLEKDLAHDMRVLVSQTIENRVDGTFCGRLSEQLLHIQLAKGCRVKITDLLTMEVMHVDLPAAAKTRYYHNLTEVDAAEQNTYWMPYSKVEEAIDAVWPARLCLQMTISSSHVPGWSAMGAVIEQLLKVRSCPARPRPIGTVMSQSIIVVFQCRFLQ